MNVFNIKIKRELAGTEEQPFVIDMLVDGEVQTVPFKLVEMSYWDAGLIGDSSNPIGMTLFLCMRKLDGSQLFNTMDELEKYPADLYSVYSAIVKLSQRVPETSDGLIELEKK